MINNRVNDRCAPVVDFVNQTQQTSLISTLCSAAKMRLLNCAWSQQFRTNDVANVAKVECVEPALAQLLHLIQICASTTIKMLACGRRCDSNREPDGLAE